MGIGFVARAKSVRNGELLETFAKGLAAGKNANEAPTSPDILRAHPARPAPASGRDIRLCALGVAEIQRMVREAAALTTEKLIVESEEVRGAAFRENQFAAVN
jgi:hypothetical protein